MCGVSGEVHYTPGTALPTQLLRVMVSTLLLRKVIITCSNGQSSADSSTYFIPQPVYGAPGEGTQRQATSLSYLQVTLLSWV